LGREELRLLPLVRLALGTGARLGELAGAHWGDFDFAKMEWRIRRTFSHGRVGNTKTASSRRTVQLAPGLVRMLLDLTDQRRREAIEHGWAELPEVIFCTAAGTYDHNIERAWQRIRRLAKAKDRGFRPLRFHCTRHTWATHALASGQPVPWVAAQGGGWGDG